MPESAIVAPVVDRNNPFLAKIIERKRLTAKSGQKEVVHVTIDLAGSGIKYKSGDSLGVCPSNKAETVNALLAALELSDDVPVTLPGGTPGATVPIREALTRKLALCHISKPLLQLACERAGDAAEKARLREILETSAPEGLKSWLDEREVLDLFEEFPSVRLSAQELASQLRKLMPRLYSVASTPLTNPERVELAVAVVRYQTNGRNREGVCSNYLAHHAPEGSQSLPVFVAPSHFAPPKDPCSPLIMVGPGVGIAPFRGFLQERALLREQGKKIGPSWLFFGDRHKDNDFLYKDELKAWMRSDDDKSLPPVLTELSLAWSRDSEQKVYVQDLMRKRGAEIWDWIHNKKGYFYVCGDARRMAKDVDAALHEIVEKHGKGSAKDAQNYVTNLRHPANDDEAHYQRDVY